jgi:HAD superfamily hydrolase (TIGR01509 family)
MALEGMIFDVDGTLVDSNDAHAAAWVDAFSEFGYQVPFAKVRRLIGMGGDKLIGVLTGLDGKGERAKELSAWRGCRFRDSYLPRIRPFPAVRELFERLKSDGIRRGIASSARRAELSDLIEVAGVADLIDEIVSADDATDSKPDADILKAALDRLHCASEGTLAVGDTPYDVQAAERAGIAIIAVRCGGWDDRELQGAREIVDSPADLLAQCDRISGRTALI